MIKKDLEKFLELIAKKDSIDILLNKHVPRPVLVLPEKDYLFLKSIENGHH